MTGSGLLGLILLSMAWLLSIGLLALNFAAWRAARRPRPAGVPTPRGVPVLPGVIGSVTVFFTLPALESWAGLVVPMPFLWILLPFLLDLGGPGGFLLAVAGIGRDAAGRDAGLPVAEPGTEAGRKLAAAEAAAVGCLLGTAVGDALGLPCEGLSRRRLERWRPPLDRYWLLPGIGMCSDDTDHAAMVAQAVTVSGGHPRRFAASLAWRLRFWLAGLPAGVGFATLRAILKLWLFVPPPYSGVRSAGNGAAMRSALLGVVFEADDALLVMHCAASSTLTHTDPRAECGALAVALAARAAMRGETPAAYLDHLRRFAAPFGAPVADLVGLVERAAASAARGEDTAAFAASIGCEREVTGFVVHTVPVALHAWLAHPRDLPAALAAVIRCGGDTDTVAAVTGAVVGAGVGRDGIPPHLLAALWDWPRGSAWLEHAARNAARAAQRRTRGAALPAAPLRQLVRNALFLAVVLAHGFRRLGPPY